MVLFLVPEEQMLKEGYPAYTTSCAWLGYSDQQLTQVGTPHIPPRLWSYTYTTKLGFRCFGEYVCVVGM